MITEKTIYLSSFYFLIMAMMIVLLFNAHKMKDNDVFYTIGIIMMLALMPLVNTFISVAIIVILIVYGIIELINKLKKTNRK
jgi:hypothetical protein|nr:MAG TPA: hypothetical protein [Caudoviricetes sp.]